MWKTELIIIVVVVVVVVVVVIGDVGTVTKGLLKGLEDL